MNYDPGLEQKVVDDGKATTKSRLWKCDGMANRRFLGRLQTQGQHCSKIMKPPQSLPLQMAERLLRAQPDSVANHVTARSVTGVL